MPSSYGGQLGHGDTEHLAVPRVVDGIGGGVSALRDRVGGFDPMAIPMVMGYLCEKKDLIIVIYHVW